MKPTEKVLEWFQGLKVGRHFLQDLRPFRGQYVMALVYSGVVIAFELARPLPIKWILDDALVPMLTDNGSSDARFSPSFVIWAAAIGTFLIAALRALFQYLREVGMAGVSHQLTRGLRFRIFEHLSRLSPLFHAKHKSGDLLVRLMGDVPMVSGMMVGSMIELLTRSLFVVGTVALMFVFDWFLTLVVLGALPIVFLVVRLISKEIHVAVRKQRRKEGDLADYLHEAIAASETIQSLGGEDQVVRRFARSNRRSARAGLKATKLGAKLSGSVESLLGLALGLTLLMGAFRVGPDGMSIGELTYFLSLVRNLLKPIRSASRHATKIAKGTACGERILTILEQSPDVTSEPGAPPVPEKPRTLTFENVDFNYEEAKPALTDFSAHFERGKLAALVGRSGAGKSTAASLAMRLMDPGAGRVLLDDVDLKTFEVDSVRGCVALSLQRTSLFGESIRENLLLGAPEASDEDIWRALEAADARGFVEGLPDGLDSELGTSGAGLSGGQESRLSLARTLLRSASVLIVDEPFAGLDRIASKHVSDTLHELARERILIVIAHDLERLDYYDTICFMDEGRKVAQGSHSELLEALPLYREVVRSTAEVS
ncbi:MAG: hypothetical protein CMJ89_03850 [Planctomycetes bacterium]|nr:hypothetical protein [Planctomycetota bacterium]